MTSAVDNPAKRNREQRDRTVGSSASGIEDTSTNIDADGEVTKAYLEDLARLAIAVPPRDMPIEALVEDVGAFLRHDAKQLRALLEGVRAEVLGEHAAAGAKLGKLPPAIARAALWVLEPDERVQFVYDGVTRRNGLSANSPKLDGREVLQAIRANPDTRDLPVIVLTTSAEPFDVEASYALGVNSYIQKPVDFEQFVWAVRQVGLYWLVLNHPRVA